MAISQIRANYGLRAVGTSTSPTATGNLTLGIPATSVTLADADVFYTVQALIAGVASDLVLDLSTGDKTGSTAWTAGTAQVETNTVVAAAGATSNGTMALVLTAAGLTGSPLTVNVALTTAAHTTAALITQAAVDALNANAAVAAMFTATRSTADIILTRKPTGTYTVGVNTVNTYAANDGTLNLNIPAGLGVTVSATSTNTTAGVLTAGCYVVGDGEDFEGNAIPTISDLTAVAITCSDEADYVLLTNSTEIVELPILAGNTFLLSATSADTRITSITPITIETASTALVTIVVSGATA